MKHPMLSELQMQPFRMHLGDEKVYSQALMPVRGPQGFRKLDYEFVNQINPKESKGSQGNQVVKLKNNSVMREIKKTNQVTFENIEYYNKNIPATGNYLLPQDDF